MAELTTGHDCVLLATRRLLRALRGLLRPAPQRRPLRERMTARRGLRTC